MLEKIIKDYFSFSRKERVAVLILALLILVISLLPHLFSDSEKVFSQAELNNLKATTTQLQTQKKAPSAIDDDHQTSVPTGSPAHDFERRYPPIEKGPKKMELFYFDPNKLSADGWKKLGISDRNIATIHNYISKGGTFRHKEDLEKIYGLKAIDAERLMAFVRIEDITNQPAKREIRERRFYNTASNENNVFPKYHNALKITDINQADSMELEALPGIGSKLASRIVHFREKLGGFYSVDQLSDVYGLPDSVFQKIRAVLKVTDTQLSLININTVEIGELKMHPYFKWNVAAAIVAYRKQHGNYQNLEDLRHVELVTNEIYSKITPYLRIE